MQPLAHLLLGDAFLGGPFRDGQVEVEDFRIASLQARDVPLLGIGLLGNVRRDQVVDDVVAHIGDGFVDIGVAHDLAPLLEDHLALIVHHVVEFEQVLADVEVARLDLLLAPFPAPC